MNDGELPPGPNDVLLGTVAGAPFSIDADQDGIHFLTGPGRATR
jgi:uncharacterized protein (DUF779 family)